jgi:lysine-N-methylase
MNPPTYPNRFRCIGSDCEDTCCQGWQITVDKPAFDRLTESPLKQIALTSIQIRPHSPNPTQYAQMTLRSDGTCPFLNPNKLCAVHATLGPESLPLGCRIYPRVLNRIDAQIESSLSLSCPEAARLVLLTPDLLGVTGKQSLKAFDRKFAALAAPATTLSQLFWPLRHLHIAILLDPALTIGQRIQTLGQLAHATTSSKQTPREILKNFRHSPPNPPPETINHSKALNSLDALLAGPVASPRFTQTIARFLTGIQFSPTASLESLASSLQSAESDHLQPFLLQHPQLLRNYLINYILRSLYPFGTISGTQSSPVLEFQILQTQFSMMYALLAGVAAFHNRQFTSAHAIETIQSFCRATEHHSAHLPDRPPVLLKPQTAAPEQTSPIPA